MCTVKERLEAMVEELSLHTAVDHVIKECLEVWAEMEVATEKELKAYKQRLAACGGEDMARQLMDAKAKLKVFEDEKEAVRLAKAKEDYEKLKAKNFCFLDFLLPQESSVKDNLRLIKDHVAHEFGIGHFLGVYQWYKKNEAVLSAGGKDCGFWAEFRRQNNC